MRQKVIENYVVDFYCSKAKLVIEVDGGQHYTEESIEYDKKRTEILEGYGLKVLRFTNLDIDNNFEGVCNDIDISYQNPSPTNVVPLPLTREAFVLPH